MDAIFRSNAISIVMAGERNSVQSPVPGHRVVRMTLFWTALGLFAFSSILQTGLIYVQQRSGTLSRWWGGRAFAIYNLITLIPWVAFLLTYVTLQFRQHPLLPWSSLWLQVIGGILAVLGAFLALWVATLFGPARLNGSRHFTGATEEERIKSGPFRWIDNPMYTGYFLVLLGIALWQNSLYDLIIALEALLLLNGVQARIENLGLPGRTDSRAK